MAVYLAFGANQSATIAGKSLSPPETFRYALNQLAALEFSVLSVSGLWESPAWPDPGAQPAYKNAVAKIMTSMQPLDLLMVLKSIERGCGRMDDVRNSPRPLDLDIIDYNQQILTSDDLTLPHPRMCERAFVLFPLQEIAPNWTDPKENRAIQDWIARLPLSDVAPLKRLNAAI